MAQRGRPRLTEQERAQREYKKAYSRLQGRVNNINKYGLFSPSAKGASELLQEDLAREIQGGLTTREYKEMTNDILSKISQSKTLSVRDARSFNKMLRETVKNKPKDVQDIIAWNMEMGEEGENMVREIFNNAFKQFATSDDKEYYYQLRKYIQYNVSKGSKKEDVLARAMEFVNAKALGTKKNKKYYDYLTEITDSFFDDTFGDAYREK